MPSITWDSNGEETIERGSGPSSERETWHGPEMGPQPSRQEQEIYWNGYEREHRQVITDVSITGDFNREKGRSVPGVKSPSGGKPKAPLPN